MAGYGKFNEGAYIRPIEESFSLVMSDVIHIPSTITEPQIIMEGVVNVLRPCKLDISGVIAGFNYYVFNVACYINDGQGGGDVAINAVGTEDATHPDAFCTYFVTSSGQVHNSVSFHTVSPLITTLGDIAVKIGVITRYQQTVFRTTINNRDLKTQGADMQSTSTLVIREV